MALLGAGRRPLPPVPTGVLDDVLAHRRPVDTAEAAVDRSVALTMMRRAGLRPGPVLPRLVAAPDDPRPPCPSPAIARLEAILGEWPELVEEWLDLARRGGWRLPGDVAAVLLARFRAVPSLRATVAALAGPLADWLAELFPEVVGPTTHRPPPGAEPVPIGRPVGLDAASIAAGLQSGELTVRHRSLLVHVVRTVPADRLESLADALGRAGTNPNTMGLALSLADLARTRLAMVREFAAATADPNEGVPER